MNDIEVKLGDPGRIRENHGGQQHVQPTGESDYDSPEAPVLIRLPEVSRATRTLPPDDQPLPHSEPPSSSTRGKHRIDRSHLPQPPKIQPVNWKQLSPRSKAIAASSVCLVALFAYFLLPDRQDEPPEPGQYASTEARQPQENSDHQEITEAESVTIEYPDLWPASASDIDVTSTAPPATGASPNQPRTAATEATSTSTPDRSPTAMPLAAPGRDATTTGWPVAESNGSGDASSPWPPRTSTKPDEGTNSPRAVEQRKPPMQHVSWPDSDDTSYKPPTIPRDRAAQVDLTLRNGQQRDVRLDGKIEPLYPGRETHERIRTSLR